MADNQDYRRQRDDHHKGHDKRYLPVLTNSNYYGYGGVYRPYGYWGGAGGSTTTTFNAYEYKNGLADHRYWSISKTQKNGFGSGVGNADIDFWSVLESRWIHPVCRREDHDGISAEAGEDLYEPPAAGQSGGGAGGVKAP